MCDIPTLPYCSVTVLQGGVRAMAGFLQNTRDWRSYGWLLEVSSMGSARRQQRGVGEWRWHLPASSKKNWAMRREVRLWQVRPA